MAEQFPLFDPIRIPLTQGYEALIDPIDADLADLKWYARVQSKHRTVYAGRGTRSGMKSTRIIHLHRIILCRILGRQLENNEFVDHIDGNGLNNCRSNLRLATKGENNRNVGRRKHNTSGYKGVSWNKWSQKWMASIQLNGKAIHLGYFPSSEAAHKAYCEAAKKYHGEFASFEDNAVDLACEFAPLPQLTRDFAAQLPPWQEQARMAEVAK